MAKNEARRGVQHCRLVGTALSVTAALGVSVAHAQQATSPAASEQQGVRPLEEVMVTARRREESAQSVPIAVTAVGEDQLENLQIRSLENLQTLVPELSVSAASGRPNAPVYSLRGIRPTEALYGQDPTAGPLHR